MLFLTGVKHTPAAPRKRLGVIFGKPLTNYNSIIYTVAVNRKVNPRELTGS